MNKTPKDKEQMTMIRLSQETREKLKYVGKKGETYDQIISRLFYEHLFDDEHGNNNTSEYEQQRLLRKAKRSTDEELHQLIVDCDASLEKIRSKGEDCEREVQACENDTLEQLINHSIEMSVGPYEGLVVGILIDKKLAETELRRRVGKP